MGLAYSQGTWDVAVRFAHTLADEVGQPWVVVTSHWYGSKSSRNVRLDTSATPATSPVKKPDSTSSRSKVSRLQGTPPRPDSQLQKAICRPPTPPKHRGWRTQVDSSHRANDFRHSAGSSGGIQVDSSNLMISDLCW